MSHVKLASNAQLTDPLISDSDALEFGRAETVRLFRIACGDLK